MHELVLTLTNSLPFSIFLFDSRGNIIFINQSAKLFLEHFNIVPLSITHYTDLKGIFPELVPEIESYFINTFSGTRTIYGFKFSSNYIADITLVPYFEKREFKNLSIIIDEKTSHYKKINAYRLNSLFLKDVIEIKDASSNNKRKLFKKTLDLLETITGQKKLFVEFGENHNTFFRGFAKNEIENLKKLSKNKEFINELKNFSKNKLVDNIYFIPVKKLEKKGLKFKNNRNNVLICLIKKEKEECFGIVVIEYPEDFIPYISMIEQLSLFMEFAPLILTTYENTKTLLEQKDFIQSIIDFLPENIIVCDKNFVVEHANKNTQKEFNINITKRHLSDLVDEKMFNAIYSISRNIQKGHKEEQSQIIINNRFFNVLVSMITIANKERYLIIIKDITEKKQMEKQLFEAERLNTIKSFLVTANDRINNPLMVMSTKLDILETMLKNGRMEDENIKKIIFTLKQQIENISQTLFELESLSEVRIVSYAHLKNTTQIQLKKGNKQ